MSKCGFGPRTFFFWLTHPQTPKKSAKLAFCGRLFSFGQFLGHYQNTLDFFSFPIFFKTYFLHIANKGCLGKQRVVRFRRVAEVLG